MEVVLSEPHVLAASGDGVGVACGVESSGPGVEHGADILLPVEDAGLLGLKKWGGQREAGECQDTGNGTK